VRRAVERNELLAAPQGAPAPGGGALAELEAAAERCAQAVDSAAARSVGLCGGSLHAALRARARFALYTAAPCAGNRAPGEPSPLAAADARLVAAVAAEADAVRALLEQEDGLSAFEHSSLRSGAEAVAGLGGAHARAPAAPDAPRALSPPPSSRAGILHALPPHARRVVLVRGLAGRLAGVLRDARRLLPAAMRAPAGARAEEACARARAALAAAERGVFDHWQSSAACFDQPPRGPPAGPPPPLARPALRRGAGAELLAVEFDRARCDRLREASRLHALGLPEAGGGAGSGESAPPPVRCLCPRQRRGWRLSHLRTMGCAAPPPLGRSRGRSRRG
jgi:hypothetical protein